MVPWAQFYQHYNGSLSKETSQKNTLVSYKWEVQTQEHPPFTGNSFWSNFAMNDGVDGVTSSIIIHGTDETQLPQSLTDLA